MTRFLLLSILVVTTAVVVPASAPSRGARTNCVAPRVTKRDCLGDATIARAFALPPGERPSRLFRHRRPRPRDLAASEGRKGAAKASQGQHRGQPRGKASATGHAAASAVEHAREPVRDRAQRDRAEPHVLRLSRPDDAVLRRTVLDRHLRSSRLRAGCVRERGRGRGRPVLPGTREHRRFCASRSSIRNGERSRPGTGSRATRCRSSTTRTGSSADRTGSPASTRSTSSARIATIRATRGCTSTCSSVTSRRRTRSLVS
jgi:hypothetical protein